VGGGMLFLWRLFGCSSLRSNSRPRKERKKEKDLKELESSLNMFCLRSKGVKEFKIIYLYIVRDFPLKCTVWFYIDSFLAQLTNEK